MVEAVEVETGKFGRVGEDVLFERIITELQIERVSSNGQWRRIGRAERTSATAVRFRSNSSFAKSSFVFPTFLTCSSSQYSPRSECETPPAVVRLAFLPMLCLEVTTRFFASRAPMRMMQPFDFVVSS